ncbi:MAG: zinc ribbon domain-containing protein [Paramuribaculum sp.]|nr:zinc ribbon domain-containing protein [Paramuribaculum sp.]
MISHLFIAAILIIAATVIGYRYLVSTVEKQKPGISKKHIAIGIGLPILQLSIWCLWAFGYWAFLPTNPMKDNGMQYYNSVFADSGISGEAFLNLYELQTSNFIQLLFFGGIAALIIYTLVYNHRTISQKAVKVLTCTNTVFSAILAWSLGSTILFGIFASMVHNAHPSMVVMVVLFYIGTAIFVIRYAIILSKRFNASIPLLMSTQPSAGAIVTGTTKPCPYCGETILTIAKKCKHCGEWIKEDDEVKVNVNTKDCPICGEQIDASATVCPICHETLPATGFTELSRNAFHKKVMAEKAAGQSQQPIISNNIIFFIVFGILILSFIIWLIGFINEFSSQVDTLYYIPGDDDPWNN